MLGLGAFAGVIAGGVWLVIPFLGIQTKPRITGFNLPTPLESPALPSLPPPGTAPATSLSAENPPQSTAALERGWETLPSGMDISTLRHDPTQPLNRDLVFVEPQRVRVREGWLRIRPGVRAKLSEDRGDRVVVRINESTVEVPRKVLANVYALPQPDEKRTILTGVTQAIGSIFQPLPNSLGIDVKEIGTGRGIDRHWDNSISYQRDYYHTKALAVDVRNVSRQGSGNCQAEVYWFARRLKDRSLSIHHAETIPLEVGPITSVTRRFWCPLATSSVRRINPYLGTDLAGSKLDGWLVVITRDGEVLARRGSGPEQNAIGESAEKLKTLAAAYQPSGRVATESMPNWRRDPIRGEWRGDTGKFYE